MAIYSYIVKKNGVWYPAGTDVPQGTDFILDNKKIGEVNDDVITITDKEIVKSTLDDISTYTKTDISRMSKAELQSLATKEGVANADNKTGGELKKILINKFGL